jgi:hypothetical protein
MLQTATVAMVQHLGFVPEIPFTDSARQWQRDKYGPFPSGD